MKINMKRLHASIPSDWEGNDLLMAVGVVGRSMGMIISPPQSHRLTTAQDPLTEIARASQMRTRHVVLEDGWWKVDSSAMVGYTLQNNPVALLPIAAGKYEYFDPQTGKYTRINQQTITGLSSSADVLYRPFPHQINNFFDLLKFAFAKRVGDGWRILLLGIAAMLLTMLLQPAMALLINLAIPNANRSLLFQLGLGLFLVSCAIAIFQIVQRRIILRMETVTDLTAQAALWDHVLKLKLPFFRQFASGDLTNRVLAINQIRGILSGVTLSSVFTSAFSLLNLGLLFVYNFQMAVAVSIITLAMILIIYRIAKLALKHHQTSKSLEGLIFGTMTQIIGGVSKLRISGAEKRAFSYWNDLYSRYLNTTLAIQSLEDLLVVCNTLLPALSGIVILRIATFTMYSEQNPKQALSIGIFLAFNVALGSFITGITSLSNTLMTTLRAKVLWERTLPLFAAPQEVDATKIDPGSLIGQIKLDQVVFRYRPDSLPALDHVTIDAHPGELIALVGASGSGKSTLLRLLLGFETPEAGVIYYDNQDLSTLDILAIRRQLGVVLQNGRVQNQSIYENIANSSLVSLDEVWEAAELAGLAEDIRAMPMGMHTVLSEGGLNLSGGQRQRLMIARALALKPCILLMDEATSALDNRTQEIVSRSLEQLQITRIVIAHRLSTIRHADRIYVLDQGKIAQVGNFDQLMSQSGLFQKLMERQTT
jgi:NHLM bacteriocin system ABC transporter ATP-binding protein